MKFNKIISVTGLGGLYELVSSKADGAVVRSLEDNATKFVSSRIHNFSHLESIEVYTTKDNTTLPELFSVMKESKEPLPDSKADNATLKAYFTKVYPDLDFDRVYASDMKKMVKWFALITKNNIEISAPEDAEAESTDDMPKAIKPSKPEPVKTTAVKPTKTATRKIESRGVK